MRSLAGLTRLVNVASHKHGSHARRKPPQKAIRASAVRICSRHFFLPSWETASCQLWDIVCTLHIALDRFLGRCRLLFPSQSRAGCSSFSPGRPLIRHVDTCTYWRLLSLCKPSAPLALALRPRVECTALPHLHTEREHESTKDAMHAIDVRACSATSDS